MAFLPAEVIALGQKNDPTSSTPVGPYSHGAGGLFSSPGQDPSIFSTIIGPTSGLSNYLPVLNEEPDLNGKWGGYDSEFFSIITGVSNGALNTFANQPTTKCADGARSGIMSVCTLVSPFARYRFSPNAPVNIFDAGRISSRLEPLALKLMNTPHVDTTLGVPSLNAMNSLSPTNTVINELAHRMFEMGFDMNRFLNKRFYIGSPANNNGEAKDLMGLDIWIAAGNKRDAYTSALCSGADSDIKNFAYNDVFTGSVDHMKYMEMVVAYLDWNTSHQGLGETWNGVIIMRPEAWEVISQVISIRQYYEALALAQNYGKNVQVTIDAKDTTEQRNAMRSNLKIPLRGRMIQIILDDSIVEETPVQTASLTPGQYASDIYFLNTEVLGGVKTAYLKTFNHDNQNSADLARLAGAQQTFTSDGGKWRWYVNHRNGCIDWTVDISPRLIVRCPQLCAKIQHVAYTPLQHFRSSDPDSSYFAAGGRTNSPTSNYYVAWQSTPASLS